MIKDADFSQNKLGVVTPVFVTVLKKSDFSILDGVFFSAANGKVAKNSSVKLSEGYYQITAPCTIVVKANSTKNAQAMLLSSIKTVAAYTNNETLPVVDNQMKLITAGTSDTLTASGSCYLCLAEYNTVDNYLWPENIKCLTEQD